MTSRQHERDVANLTFYPSKIIKGTIQACTEQTVGFKWHLLVDTILTLLHLPAYEESPEAEFENKSYTNPGIYFSLSKTQLEGLLDLLVTVSRVYRDHVIVSMDFLANLREYTYPFQGL